MRGGGGTGAAGTARVRVLRVVGWFAVAVACDLLVLLTRGRDDAANFAAAYLLEQSLSVDNLVAFLVVFRLFKARRCGALLPGPPGGGGCWRRRCSAEARTTRRRARGCQPALPNGRLRCRCLLRTSRWRCHGACWARR